ncbi:MAG: hypothetical protein ACNFW9_04920 [Candidatus Kerfeldbacteria bacterium]
MLTNTVFKKFAMGFMTLAMFSMILMTVGCSDNDSSQHNPIASQYDGLLDEQQLSDAIAYVKANEMTIVAVKELSDRGYEVNYDQAIGGQSEGITGIIIPFKGKNDSSFYLLRFIEENEVVSVDVTEVNVIDSETAVGTTYNVSKKGIMSKAAASSWWSCFWLCVLDKCGGGAIGCIYAGPFWYPCVTGICGFSAWLCAFIICKY